MEDAPIYRGVFPFSEIPARNFRACGEMRKSGNRKSPKTPIPKPTANAKQLLVRLQTRPPAPSVRLSKRLDRPAHRFRNALCKENAPRVLRGIGPAQAQSRADNTTL